MKIIAAQFTLNTLKLVPYTTQKPIPRNYSELLKYVNISRNTKPFHKQLARHRIPPVHNVKVIESG